MFVGPPQMIACHDRMCGRAAYCSGEPLLSWMSDDWRSGYLESFQYFQLIGLPALPAITANPEIKRAIVKTRARKRQANCKRGHELSPENVYLHQGTRYCRECGRLRHRLRKRGTLA